MKKGIIILLVIVLGLLSVAFVACDRDDSIVIAVPNDATNEARALVLLEQLGLIELKEGAGISATVRDIASNPYNIKFKEVEAVQLPNFLQDVDYAIINSNYAISAGLNPSSDALALEGAYSAYSNILAVKEGNQNSAKIKALVSALLSQRVKDYITSEYNGAVLSVVENAGEGFDSTIDYSALAGATIKVGASPVPHAEILKIAKQILAEKNITLDIVEYSDYVQPNLALQDGSLDANYFQHLPYLEDFNASNNTSLVSACAVHVEPIGIYSKNHTSLEDIKK